MPLCYPPKCTVIVIDDANFTKNPPFQGKLSVLSFTTADSTTEYFHNQFTLSRIHSPLCLAKTTKRHRTNFPSNSSKVYNHNRFKEVLISVVDYDIAQQNWADSQTEEEMPADIQRHSLYYANRQHYVWIRST